MSQRWKRLCDRVTGRAVDPELAQAIVQWSQASAAMARLVGSGSVISADERSVVLVALAALRELPSGDSDLLARAASLEDRLIGDELALVSADQEVV